MTGWRSYVKNDPTGDKARSDHEDMMRGGSRLLLWRIARLQARREGALAQFAVMQELLA